MCQQLQGRCQAKPQKDSQKIDNQIVLNTQGATSLHEALRQMDKMLSCPDEKSGLVHMVSLIKHLQKVRQNIR